MSAPVHLSGYQRRDHEVVDYRMGRLPGTELEFREAPSALPGPGAHVVCLGAAQTFGCLVTRPFPSLLADELGLPVLNLGYGGAGPAFFLGQPGLLDVVNRARVAVIQVMSARSESNARFDSGGLEFLTRRADGARLGAAQAWQAELDGDGLVPGLRAPWARWVARRIGRARTRLLVRETRHNWIASHHRLAAAIRIPKVLFWFARRPPRYDCSTRTLRTLFGEFPHLVDERTLAAIEPDFERSVRCVSVRGSPHLLRSRFTGEPCTIDPGRDRPDLGGTPWSHDHYYPSPEMHEDAAAALLPVLRELLGEAAERSRG